MSDCNEEEYGELVECQEDNEHVAHYGNACAIGHTGILSFLNKNILYYKSIINSSFLIY